MLKIALASRALFDLDASHTVFASEGVTAYADYQMAHEQETLQEGVAFSLVKKLLALRHPVTEVPLVEVLLVSRNSADTGLRIFNSIAAYALPITRAVFTNGTAPYQYLAAFGAHLFLSANPQDVTQALNSGYAAATILPSQVLANDTAEIRIAFDGDAVLFAPEAEAIYHTQGLAAFSAQEQANAQLPLVAGAFKDLLSILHDMQKLYPDACPLRTALVTARAAPAHERVIRTLRYWQIRLDEALFLGGLPKGEFLKAFQADFFFDDQPQNCWQTSQHVFTAHVPQGAN